MLFAAYEQTWLHQELKPNEYLRVRRRLDEKIHARIALVLHGLPREANLRCSHAG